MVNVLAIHIESGARADEAREDCQSRVHQRQSENHQGDRDGHTRRRLLGAQQRKGSERETDEERPRIAEEDGGRVKVKAKEPGHSSAKRESNYGHKRMVEKQRD